MANFASFVLQRGRLHAKAERLDWASEDELALINASTGPPSCEGGEPHQP
ncbi:hypothetical protein DB30_01232 [Enhygromyxa salina]|uniref:Uncharacterized protein n=1 Tax=Enhygromyxa salina TaxID=215803 RepID=A0A0C1Z4H2_9BACT|nr:hypothetical protein DB30_01232 [Enhygromyxa salina]